MVQGKAYPEGLNLYFVYIVYILDSCIPYLFGGYRSILFTADQRKDIVNKIGGTCACIMYISQIVSIVILEDLHIYTVLMLFNSILTLVLQNVFFRKYYPGYNCEGNVTANFRRDFFRRMTALAFSKIRNVSRNSFDSIEISYFLGLTILAQYQNYYQVLLVPVLLIGIACDAVVPSLGNKMMLERKKRRLSSDCINNLLDKFKNMANVLSSSPPKKMYGEFA